MNQHLIETDAKHVTTLAEDRSNFRELDLHRTTADRTPGVVPAAEFNQVVGGLDLDTLRDHHLAIAMAVIEFAADADRPLPWSHDDPTVALLRAAAQLGLTAPDATSSAAFDLLERLGSTGDDAASAHL